MIRKLVVNGIKALNKWEWALWGVSVLVILSSFLLGQEKTALSLIASLVGVTSLIFIAKGQPLGQALTVVFSLLYAVVSLEFRYYGEMITYLGMTAPMAILSVVTWLRHPFEEGKMEVAVARMNGRRIVWGIVGAAVATGSFYFILRYFGNANLIISTISVTTSFLASYLTYCRSCTYALAYAANDVVLIVLWILAAMESPAHLPMVLCFGMFLLNDLYAFFNWRRMALRQAENGAD